jgi:monoamine oxidase
MPHLSHPIDYLAVIQNGLPQVAGLPARRKKILIVGGEMDRLNQALENLAQIHPQATREVEAGASKMWHDDEFAGGAFALFDPGQQTLLHPHIIAPEGRIYFAGEHASLAHAWIQGAIESGLRAAFEVHTAP